MAWVEKADKSMEILASFQEAGSNIEDNWLGQGGQCKIHTRLALHRKGQASTYRIYAVMQLEKWQWRAGVGSKVERIIYLQVQEKNVLWWLPVTAQNKTGGHPAPLLLQIECVSLNDQTSCEE